LRMNGPELNIDAPHYPVWDGEKMLAALQIQDDERVLDVGGGHQPFLRADVVADLSFIDSDHRGGYEAVKGESQQWVEANIENLPFHDQSFDFVYCTHVLEHTVNPEKACRELMRVASRGFLEVPRKFTEYLAGYPAHRWLIDWVDGKLVFDAKTFVESPFTSFALSVGWNNPDFAELASVTWRHLSNVQLYWEKQFDFQINDSEERIDLSNDKIKGRAYLDYAFNQLRWRAPVMCSFPEAELAVKLLPDDPIAWHVVAVYRAMNGQNEAASQSFRRALSLAPDEPSLQHNFNLWFASGALEGGLLPGTDRAL